jgi:hypothetical protein
MRSGPTSPNAHAGIQGAEGSFHVLVVANETLEGEAAATVAAEARRRAGQTEPAVHVVSPVLAASRLKHQMNDVDDQREPAHERLEASIEALRGQGLAVAGEMGETDPVQAISDELQKRPVDHILVVTHDRDEESAYAEKELFERVAREFEEPATELRVSGHGAGERVAAREQAPARSERAEGGHEPDANLPPLRRLDSLGLLVAAIGTIALVLIAGTCEDHGHEAGDGIAQFSGGCALVYLIAGGFFLINIAHVVALLLMQSVNYRGPFERFFARISLYGTPLAVVAAALIVWL